MSDTLVVAISQSGTTTDTNRTVDLVRGRGATVVAIVNRRNSDLTDKADGVLYTSDGRDVEMSVRVDQGVLRAGRRRASCSPCAIADEVGATDDRAERRRLLAALRELPDAMEPRARQPRPSIAEAAQRFAPEPPLLGGRRQRRQPHRRRRSCGSSSPSSATSRSPATPPRTRSTSTCRPSR